MLRTVTLPPVMGCPWTDEVAKGLVGKPSNVGRGGPQVGTIRTAEVVDGDLRVGIEMDEESPLYAMIVS